MSALPDHEKKAAYSEDDVQHIVAREMAKQQLVQLQNGQLETNKRLVEIVSEFRAELKGIKAMLDKTPESVDSCKADLKKEIREDHPDRIEMLRLERDILARIDALNNKVEKQWLKITVTLTVLTTVITIIGSFLNYFLLVQKAIG